MRKKIVRKPAGERMQIKGIAANQVANGTNILSIEVPKELEVEVQTKVGFVDDAMGGNGFTPSSCMLFTGTSGAGKTTLALQLADSITGAGHICLFNTCEESLVQVRKVTKRLKSKHGFYVATDHLVANIIKHAKQLMDKHPGKQIFVICDSLQTLDDGKYPNGYTNAMTAVRSATMLAGFAKTKTKGIYPITIVIGQVNKDGQFAGKNMVKHAVDIHTHLSIDDSKKSETYGMRLLEVTKNRFGCNGRMYVLDMQSDGLREVMSYSKADVAEKNDD
jgi:predicted ATP-dependent serine protease